MQNMLGKLYDIVLLIHVGPSTQENVPRQETSYTASASLEDCFQGSRRRTESSGEV